MQACLIRQLVRADGKRGASAVIGCELMPWDLPYADTAAALRRARSLCGRGSATVSVEVDGRYRSSSLDIVMLKTERC